MSDEASGKDPPDPERAGDAEPEPRAPRKRRKRKRKASPEPAQRRAGGPAFAWNFPSDPDLDALVDAFERGNHALVRERAGRLSKDDARSDEVRRAASELLQRIEPDPIAVLLLAAAVGLLAFLSFWYWSHAHAVP